MQRWHEARHQWCSCESILLSEAARAELPDWHVRSIGEEQNVPVLEAHVGRLVRCCSSKGCAQDEMEQLER